MPRILLIDDDEKFCRLLRDYLTPLGYDIEAVHDGPSGLARALDPGIAAVILDVMIPGLGGFDVLRELRRTSQVPVLMLTALGDEVDRIAGLELGADDYVPKTFSPRELLARLRAVLRRSIVAATHRPAPEPTSRPGPARMPVAPAAGKLAGVPSRLSAVRSAPPRIWTTPACQAAIFPPSNSCATISQ